MTNDLVSSFIEIKLNHSEDFLKIKETLTRIGVSSKERQTVYQTCHILHKAGKYYIVHFKELFLLDQRAANLTAQDIARRNTIAMLLSDWGLLSIVNPSVISEQVPVSAIKIISHSEKSKWALVSKYSIGKKQSDA